MKIVTSYVIALGLCGVTYAQSGSSGTHSSNWGFTIGYQSKTEPESPAWAGRGQSGALGSGDERPILRRYATNTKTHEIFGYDMEVEAIDPHAERYRLTFKASSVTPEALNLDGSWHMTPPPMFPPPQVISSADTVAVDLFVNPQTGQKIVDYIRIRRDSCDSESAGNDQLSCLDGVLQDAKDALAARLSDIEKKRDAATVALMKGSQQAWEAYRDTACGSLAGDVKRLKCEIALTGSRKHDVGEIYR